MHEEMISRELERLRSVEETGRALGLCRSTVYNLLKRNELTSVQIGRRRLIREDSVRALIERSITRDGGQRHQGGL